MSEICQTCRWWRPTGERLDPPVFNEPTGLCEKHGYISTCDVGCTEHQPGLPTTRSDTDGK